MDAPGSYDIERRWKQSSLPSSFWESCFPPLQMRVPVIAPPSNYPILIRDTPLVLILVSALCGSVFNPRLEIRVAPV